MVLTSDYCRDKRIIFLVCFFILWGGGGEIVSKSNILVTRMLIAIIDMDHFTCLFQTLPVLHKTKLVHTQEVHLGIKPTYFVSFSTSHNETIIVMTLQPMKTAVKFFPLLRMNSKENEVKPIRPVTPHQYSHHKLVVTC